MRLLIVFLAAMVGSTLVPAFAQSSDPMDLQRCIWGCLANSKGNDDPAYHACVKQFCVEEEQSSVEQTGQQPKADRQTVMLVQRSLAARGFDPGPADGIWGRRTAAAVKAFQRSEGLTQSGIIDEALVSALRSAEQSDQSGSASSSPQNIATRLDVPILEHGGDGQMSNCGSSVVTGLKTNGDGFLAVRSGPGTGYRKIDELHNGDVVYAFDRKGDWVGVAYKVQSLECASTTTRPIQYEFMGWVHGKWLSDLAG
ncbi:peptidoglycan-binding protein [Roseibium sp. SCP14]|uniref:peptidoglycan-binding protein n=1 Tax=Roseibium sp. SCP14 TaxID=3141375 RepID=UPI0033372A50